MKKLFRLFSLLAVAGLMTACGSDDPEAWTQLPKDEISTESGALSLTINGQAAQAASAKFNAINDTTGIITLINAIPGYNEVPVNVKMSEQNNGMFQFKGTTKLTTAPSRAEQAGSDKAFMTVDVAGDITTDGKAMVTISASGAAFYIGAYRNDSLSLSYWNKIPCPGRTVTYAAVNDVPVLTLIGVVPGDYIVSIPGVYPADNGSFEGNATTESGTTLSYEGQFNAGKGELVLNVKPTLSTAMQGGIAKTWNLSLDPEATIDESYNYHPTDYPPFRMIWNAKNKENMNGEQIATLASRALSHFMVDLLSNVTLNTNGILTAKYGDIDYVEDQLPDFDDPNIGAIAGWFFKLLDVEMKPTQTKWLESPAGLAYWYCRGDYFYFVPDIMMIVAQANKDNDDSEMSPEMIMGLLSQLAQMKPEEILNYANQILPSLGLQGVDLSDVNPETIRTVLSWLQTGVPLKYKVDGNYLSLYVDKEMAEPFMTLIFKFLPMLQGVLDKAAAGNPMMSMMWGMLGITKLDDLQTIWKDNTAEFKIAINFTNTPAAPASLHRAARKAQVKEYKTQEDVMNAFNALINK